MTRFNSGLALRADFAGGEHAASFVRPRLSAALTPPTLESTSSQSPQANNQIHPSEERMHALSEPGKLRGFNRFADP
jgi:hypothetical protein